MDLGSILGIVAGLGLIGYAIASGGGAATFINVPSMLIVVGGTIAATAIAFPTKELKSVFTVTKRVFNNPKSDMQSIVDFLVDAAKTSRNGPRALEDMAKKSDVETNRKRIGSDCLRCYYCYLERNYAQRVEADGRTPQNRNEDLLRNG